MIVDSVTIVVSGSSYSSSVAVVTDLAETAVAIIVVSGSSYFSSAAVVAEIIGTMDADVDANIQEIFGRGCQFGSFFFILHLTFSVS